MSQIQKFLNLTTNPLLAFQVKEVVIYLILEEKHFLEARSLEVVISNVWI